MVIRVWSRVRSAIFRPCPSSPTSRSAGSGTSSRSSSRVGEPLMPSLRSFAPNVKPGVALLHDERGDAAAAGRRIRHRHDGVVVGHARVGDPRLLPVQHPAVPGPGGAGPHARGIRAGLALGQPVREHRLAPGDRRQVTLLHVLARGQQQRHRAELVHRRDQRGRDAAARDLLDDDAGRQRVGAGTVVALGQVRRMEADGLQRVVRLLGEARLLVDLGGVRGDLVVDQLADGLAQVVVIRAEPVVREVVHAADITWTS